MKDLNQSLSQDIYFYMYILETMYCHTPVISKLLNIKISSETYLKAPIAMTSSNSKIKIAMPFESLSTSG